MAIGTKMLIFPGVGDTPGKVQYFITDGLEIGRGLGLRLLVASIAASGSGGLVDEFEEDTN